MRVNKFTNARVMFVNSVCGFRVAGVTLSVTGVCLDSAAGRNRMSARASSGFKKQM